MDDEQHEAPKRHGEAAAVLQRPLPRSGEGAWLRASGAQAAAAVVATGEMDPPGAGASATAGLVVKSSCRDQRECFDNFDPRHDDDDDKDGDGDDGGGG